MGDENILEVTAEILPNGLGGWYIKATYVDTGESMDCQNVEEYSLFIQNASKMDPEKEFKATWLPSEKATREHIEEVRKEMLELEEFYKSS